MGIEEIRNAIFSLAEKYSIKKATLFGSRAAGTNNENSDVDLIIEFSCNVSLLTLSRLKLELEEILSKDVDIIHGPVTEDDLIVIDKEVELYAA